MRSRAEVQRLKSLTLCCAVTFTGVGASGCDRTPEVKPDTTLPTPPASPKAEPTKAEPTKAEPTQPEPTTSFRSPTKARLVAIGDIHGDLTALRAALRLAGAIDSDDKWVGKDLTVVQTGDQIDRGDQDREVLDVVEKLEGDAKSAGSELIVLNGNHELMNAGFDFRYVTKRSFQSFGELAQRAPASAQGVPDDERGRAAAFAPGGPYALKLSRHLTVAVVGDSLFAHGGVLPAHIDYGLERLNREASAFLAGKLPRLPAALSAEDSPVWTRLYGSPEVDDATCESLGRVLTQVGAKRLIVGHTVQKGGIQSACHERLFRIDVGLSAFYGDNPPEVLEITAQGTRILKPGYRSIRCAPVSERQEEPSAEPGITLRRMSAVLETLPLGFPWQTVDPFLFCVHHDDAYPAGNEKFGPQASLAGRNLGNDFVVKDGFRMYHGEVVPGFPQHPHRGFETVTLARRGYIDHSDSLGAAARFGRGDAQWLTAGGGIVHSEMFPLLDPSAPNPVELFQIWLNLPGEDKLTKPHFAMLWEREIPRHHFKDAVGRNIEVTTVAGALEGKQPPPPPPKSWAARPDTDVAIWTLKLEAGAAWTLPKAQHPEAIRTLYFFAGPSVKIDDRTLTQHCVAVVRSDIEITLEAGAGACELLMLQGRPIGEPVAQHGPFVMNTREEIQQAFADYQRTRFGGWPWPADDPVHGGDAGRFAKHIDGHIEKAE